MTFYFEDPEAVEKLESTCQALQGAWFSANYQCKDLVKDALAGAGIQIPEIKNIPETSIHHGRFHSKSALVEFLMETPEIRKHLAVIDKDDPWIPGDMIIIQEGRSAHHMGIMGKERLYHLPMGGCVVQKSQEWARLKAVAVFRIKAEC